MPLSPTGNSAEHSAAATTSFSVALDKLDAVREWVRDGIPKTLDSEGGEFMLGIESASVIDALDYIEGRLLNAEAEEVEHGKAD